MRRFLRYGLVLLVLLAFAAALVLLPPVLQAQAEQVAKADLTVLANAALARMESAETLYEEIRSSADEGILSRARAVSRVVAHDDTLLTPEALTALCEQLDLYLIDVTAADGEVVGSSEAGYVGKNITEDETLAWMEAVLEDPTKEYTETDPGDDSVRMGCVPRDDSVGMVLVRAKDRGVAAAKVAAEPAEVLRQMSFIKDSLELSEGAAEGAAVENGLYVVRVTKDGVTVAASRALSSVYTLRNAAILALGVLGIVCLAAAMVIQLLLRRKPRRSKPHRAGGRETLPEEPDAPETLSAPESAEPEADEAPAEPEAGEQAEPEIAAERKQEAPAAADASEARTVQAAEQPERSAKEKKRKEKKPRQKIFEFVEVEETAVEPLEEAPSAQALPEEPPAVETPADRPDRPVRQQKPRKAKSAGKGKAPVSGEGKAPVSGEGENEEGFDKVF